MKSEPKIRKQLVHQWSELYIKDTLGLDSVSTSDAEHCEYAAQKITEDWEIHAVDPLIRVTRHDDGSTTSLVLAAKYHPNGVILRRPKRFGRYCDDLLSESTIMRLGAFLKGQQHKFSSETLNVLACHLGYQSWMDYYHANRG